MSCPPALPGAPAAATTIIIADVKTVDQLRRRRRAADGETEPRALGAGCDWVLRLAMPTEPEPKVGSEDTDVSGDEWPGSPPPWPMESGLVDYVRASEWGRRWMAERAADKEEDK